jgi:predicted esterase
MFPLFVFLNGNDGGRGDTLPLDRKTVGSNDFICANLPLFKRTFDKTDGGLVTVDDFETVSRAYRAMLQKLFDTVPNITPERSALGGFSNGAHTTALLLAGHDDFILRHFRAFYFVEGGSPLAANALHRAALKHCRFLFMRGDQADEYLSRALELGARERGLDFTFITMRETGHEFPLEYQRLLGLWIRGERLPEAKPK